MKTFIDIFNDHKIKYYATLPLSACHTTRPYLYEREGLSSPKSVLLFLVPYYTGAPHNFSAYAASRDYHAFMHTLGRELLPAMATAYPENRFLLFSDHSPIDERDAAARAGLGVIGENGLLITEAYSSFVFIGELFTDLAPEALSAVPPRAPRGCEGCGACRAACPSGALCDPARPCLSALTQKKGALTDEEADMIRKGGSVWGCDACQNACPYTARARADGTLLTPIPYFYTDRMERLTRESVAEMPEEKFRSRAFSWRGRDILLRNLSLFEDT